MPRVKLTEYRAKKLLLGESYLGVSDGQVAGAGTFVVKVDQGVKKRFKNGLVLLDQNASSVPHAIKFLRDKGYSSFLVEPMLMHKAKDEQYLSFERVRGGIRILHSISGGVNIEDGLLTLVASVTPYLVQPGEELPDALTDSIPADFLKHTLNVFDEQYFSFLELNPLVVVGGKAYPLDAAALVDSAASFFVKGWSEADVPNASTTHSAEAAIAELQKTSPASFKLTVLNPNGSFFFLLSGGGGSIVVADEAASQGMGGEIGNYGEYSGGPTREETYLYTKQVVELMLASSATKKALVIAGGVANFTDVKQTFLGIVDALTETADKLREKQVRVFVRRGGPNEEEGLKLMRDFLERETLLGSVHGSGAVITKAVSDAIAYINV